MKTWFADKVSESGWIRYCVAKLSNKPNKMEMGSAGRALRNMANSNNVKHNPSMVVRNKGVKK